MTDEVEYDDTPVSRAYQRLVKAEAAVLAAIKERDEAFRSYGEEAKLDHAKRLAEKKNKV